MDTEESKETEENVVEAKSDQDKSDDIEAKNKEKELKEIEAKNNEAKNKELVAFTTWLKKECLKDKLESKLKASNVGLFVAEDFLYDFIDYYQNWFQAERSEASLPSKDKLIQKLFGSDNPELFYTIIGKQAFSGFLVAVKIISPQKLGIPIYKGEPLSALNYLHPKDNSLVEIEGVEVKKTNLGIKFKLSALESDFYLDFDKVIVFAKVLRNSKPTTVRYPEVVSSLRGVVKNLPKILAKFKKHKSKFNLLIPSKYRNEKDLSFYRLGELVLICRKDELIDIYELKGKNRLDLLYTELSDNNLERSLKKYRFRVYRNPGKSLASFELHNSSYKISVVAFLDYLEFLSRSSVFKKVRGNFTVFTAIKLMLDSFSEATPIDNRDINKYVPSYLTKRRFDGRLKSPLVFLYSNVKAKNPFKSLDYVGEYRKKIEKKIEIKKDLTS